MRDEPIVGRVVEDFSTLQQGDVVRLRTPGLGGAAVGLSPQEIDVAILSQTCDVVSTKPFCLVAPIYDADASEASAARKGKKPLLLCFANPEEEGQRVFDIGAAFSVGKSEMSQAVFVQRPTSSPSGEEARRLSARIGRAFSRFAVPDEVHPVFSKLQSRIRDRFGRGNFGRVVDLAEDFRLSADQWHAPGRRMRVHVILPEDMLIPDEDVDLDWSTARVAGWKPSDILGELTLDRVCELILTNLEPHHSTTLLRLWQDFGSAIFRELIEPMLGAEVASCVVEVVSEVEFSYRDYRASESLDLETLSDSKTSGDDL